MNLIDIVLGRLASWPAPTEGQQDVAVSTHCLYPSNGVVCAYVSGRNDTFKVSDGGGALKEYISGRSLSREDLGILKAAAAPQGLDVTPEGVILSPLVNAEQLLGAIILVANASKEAAFALAAKFIPAPKKNFRETLAKLIDGEFGHALFLDVTKRRPVIGASTKSHRFDYELTLPGRKRLLLDAVIPEPSSINSVLAANLDVKQAEHDGTIQRIVYDDQDDWKAADLSLLGLGATVIPFTKIRPVLGRLAA